MRLIVDLSIYFSEQPNNGTEQAARLIKALDSSAQSLQVFGRVDALVYHVLQIIVDADALAVDFL